ncbi:hypothetical protein V5F29_05180 [Xanthobacter aminoxidans]|uniref:hypothetical protein n=1 Tax=Xanthobacter aminoxidans TaxID=186280 RepID=UPI00372CB7D4
MEEANRIRSKLTGDFSVTQRPEPIPGNLRLGWGISLLLLVLASSRGQRCSLQKIRKRRPGGFEVINGASECRRSAPAARRASQASARRSGAAIMIARSGWSARCSLAWCRGS